jgi:ubiquinone/menaquinone biosynthesis C-methylase UbiE
MELEAKQRFIQRFDSFYTRFAGLYDWLVKRLPIWRGWIEPGLPFIKGPRVLEIPFGTGCLMAQYASRFETYGIDYNQRMAVVARANLKQAGLKARLQVSNVEALPYAHSTFDSVVNTMAFSGYPDATLALSEIRRF